MNIAPPASPIALAGQAPAKAASASDGGAGSGVNSPEFADFAVSLMQVKSAAIAAPSGNAAPAALAMPAADPVPEIALTLPATGKPLPGGKALPSLVLADPLAAAADTDKSDHADAAPEAPAVSEAPLTQAVLPMLLAAIAPVAVPARVEAAKLASGASASQPAMPRARAVALPATAVMPAVAATQAILTRTPTDAAAQPGTSENQPVAATLAGHAPRAAPVAQQVTAMSAAAIVPASAHSVAQAGNASPAAEPAPAADVAAPAIAAPAPSATPATIAPAPISHAAPQRIAFGELVESIARARDHAGTAPVQVTLSHAEFGPVAMKLRHDGDALAVTLSAADAGLAAAVHAARSADEASLRQDTPGQQQSQQQARGDDQRGASANTPGAQTQSTMTGGQSQAQPQASATRRADDRGQNGSPGTDDTAPTATPSPQDRSGRFA